MRHHQPPAQARRPPCGSSVLKRAAAGDVAFAPGRRVTIRSIDEILTTLDGDGTSGGLVFMPEMARYCGETLEVLDRVDMTCVESGGLRGFRGEEDVYLLRDVRCDGAEHDGCQKACLIFWKRSWLTDAEPAHMARSSGGELKPGRLKVRTDDGRYFCQSSNLLQATHVLSRVQKLRVGLNQLRTGKVSVGSLLYALGLALRVRVDDLLRPRRRDSHGRKHYMASLRLERGDCVKTNTLQKINETLDAKGCNRGLAFTRY